MIILEETLKEKINIKRSLLNSANFVVENNNEKIRVFKNLNLITIDRFSCFLMTDTIENTTEFIATEILYDKQTGLLKVLNRQNESCEILLSDVAIADVYSIGSDSILIILSEMNYEEK